MIPPPGYHDSDTAAATTAPPIVESDWALKLPNPLTYQQGLDALNAARKYALDIVDRICSGTCPPPEYMVPDLIARLKEMYVARDGFKVMVDRGLGAHKMPDKLRTAAKDRGIAVIKEGDRIWAATVAEDKRLKNLIKGGASTFGIVVKGALIVAGILGTAKILSEIRGTSREVRLTVRGYKPPPG